MRTRLALVGITLALSGCAKQPKAETPQAQPSAQAQRSIENRDWDLVAVGEKDHPLGNGGRPATLRFDTQTQRAGGNAGCNRYNATYRLSGDSLSFGPAISTKMACEAGMDLEVAWLSALEKVATYSVTDSTLTLLGADGPVARLEAHRAP